MDEKKNRPTPEEVGAQFGIGFDCSQVVAEYFAEDMGLSVETARKVAACYGGGCGVGVTCGAVVGALMALGMKYGQYDAEHMEQKKIMSEKRAAFFEAFSKEYGSPLCRDLLGFDLSIPEERQQVLEAGTMMTLCPRIVSDTIRMTEDLLQED